jgi:O-antigen ligase
VAAYHDGFLVDQLVVRQGTGSDADLLSTGFSGIPADDTSGTSLWRVRGLGILNDPNDLGQAIVMCLPLLFAGWRARRLLRNLLWVVAPGALLVYTVYLTHSRGALVGVGVLLLYALRNRLGTVRAALVAVLGLGVLLGSGLGGGREFSTQEESAGQRVEAWYEGLQMLRENPMFGIGYGRFTDFHNLTAHNSFVLCFAETGLLGLFAWVGLLVVAWRELGQVATLHPVGSEARRRAEALRAALLGFLACAWFLSRTFQPLLYLLLALCFSTAWVLRRSLADAPGAAPVATPPWVVRTVGATFGSVALVYTFVVAERLAGN